MRKKKRKFLFIGLVLVLAFIIWTILVRFLDVKNIGPQESNVGFADLNGYVHNIIGVNMFLYTITDWLGLVPIAIAFAFAVLGLIQLCKRKAIFKVDKSILILGLFYTAVIFVYILFEVLVINYRPVLINGYLEASYPSSTTMLVMCVMPSAIVEISMRVKHNLFKKILMFTIIMFIAFMVIGRIISGVHWLSDIIGATLISSGLVIIYYSFMLDFKK